MSITHAKRYEEMQLPARSVEVRTIPVPRGLRNPLYWGTGERLRALGIANNLTQTEIAAAAGVSRGMISNIEHGVHVPRIDVVERLATALGVLPSWLAFGTLGDEPWAQRSPHGILPPKLPTVSLARREMRDRYKLMGLRLRQEREARGLTLRALSPLVDAKWKYLPDEKRSVSRQTILQLEAGETVPLVKTVEVIALALNIAPGLLAYGRDDEYTLRE
jgi:transcriptional regulator with XRE-family HTH domain